MPKVLTATGQFWVFLSTASALLSSTGFFLPYWIQGNVYNLTVHLGVFSPLQLLGKTRKWSLCFQRGLWPICKFSGHPIWGMEGLYGYDWNRLRPFTAGCFHRNVFVLFQRHCFKIFHPRWRDCSISCRISSRSILWHLPLWLGKCGIPTGLWKWG